jgi:hypothetical protein
MTNSIASPLLQTLYQLAVRIAGSVCLCPVYYYKYCCAVLTPHVTLQGENCPVALLLVLLC